MKIDELYMRRALQLARNGEGRVSPNPLVGAVIVADDRIIGEGFHAVYGGPHAEVNAIRSVKDSDRPLLKDANIYVTLEPCSHHGKTPPCANLIVDTGIPRVVIGASDPNPLVAGNGVRILRNAGVEVSEGILEEECRTLNRNFMKAQTSPLPYIILKWAQSADRFMAALNDSGDPVPVKFSSPLSSVWVHRLRAGVDAIMVGGNTERIDQPLLNTRLWGGNSPKKYVSHFSSGKSLREMLEEIRKEGVTSLLVEGGPTLLSAFFAEGLGDEIRIETSPVILGCGLSSPQLHPGFKLSESFKCRDNIIQVFRR